MKRSWDVLIIGAGPAGLAAASIAAELGLSTILVDQQPAPGGQIYRGVEASPTGLRDMILGKDYAHGAELVARFRASGAAYRPGAAVFDVTADGWVGVASRGQSPSFIHARRIIAATGAMERPFPIPGWTLPGVMTAGAAQILLKQDRLTPTPNTVLIGSGPLCLLLAAQLERAGTPLANYVDTTPRGSLLHALPHLPQALRNQAALRKGLSMMTALRRSGTAWHRNVANLRIEGRDRVEALLFDEGGSTRRIPADLVLLHQGVVPNIQLTQALRCRHVWDESQLCWRPETDRWGRSSLEHVMVCGDGRGISGALAAEAQGRLAALAAAFDLGLIAEKERDRRAAADFRIVAAETALRPFLESLYRPAREHRVPPDDGVIVCRCEEVTAGDVRDMARSKGVSGPNQLKAFLRAGMGPCQGRMCGLTVCEMIADTTGRPAEEIGYYRLRMPIRPVPLAAYAEAALPAEDIERKPDTP